MALGNHWKGWLVAAAIISASCGGRTALVGEEQPLDAAGSGGSSFGDQGGGAPRGGNWSNAGTFGQAGTFQSAGTFGDAGTTSGGAVGDCPLAVADCMTPAEPVCQGVRRACSGDFQTHTALDAVGDVAGVAVSELSVSVDGRVAIAGFFHGKMTLGGHVLTSPKRANDSVANATFVASFNDHGDVEWATAYPGQTNQEVTGLDFAPNGDVVMQAFTAANNDEPRAATVRFDAAGKVLWSKDWGKLGHVGPSHVGIDNDGRTWLGGSMSGNLGFPGSDLKTDWEQSAYVLSLDPLGNPLKGFTTMPKGMISGAATGMAVDDEDSIILVGNARSETNESFAFLEKLSSDGAVIYSKLYSGNLRITGVTVDRLMRPILVAEFSERFTNEGTIFISTGTTQLWLAQYTREGSLTWQRAYEGDFSDNSVSAGVVTADPFGNIIVNGTGNLVIGGNALVSHHMNDLGNPDITWLMKLRPDATRVWTRQIDGAARISGIGTDNAGSIWLGGQFMHKIWLGDEPVTGSSLIVQMSP